MEPFSRLANIRTKFILISNPIHQQSHHKNVQVFWKWVDLCCVLSLSALLCPVSSTNFIDLIEHQHRSAYETQNCLVHARRMYLMKLILNSSIADAQPFKCPDGKSGRYQDAMQCDKYYVCDNDVATEKLCPDGLMFDESKSKCDQPFRVDCGDRLELQTSNNPSDECPRKNGFFAHPDRTVCNIFYNCIDGKANEMKCMRNTFFDQESAKCVGSDSIELEGCKLTHEWKKAANILMLPTSYLFKSQILNK